MKHNLLILLWITLISNSPLQLNEKAKSNNSEESQELWHDLITPNLEESKIFYGDIFGWTFEDSNFKGTKMTTIINDGNVIGGMIEVKNANTSTWICALPLSTEALNQRIKSVLASGAKAVLPPVKIPGRGKQVVFEGPLGEEFSLISENDYTKKVTPKGVDKSWIGIELWASNTSRGQEFYETAFGVSTTQISYDNKPYWVFKSGEKLVAGMINNPIKNQGSQWVPYIKSTSINELFLKLKNSKAAILLTPTEEVRKGNVGIIQDPHGAIIAIQNTKS